MIWTILLVLGILWIVVDMVHGAVHGARQRRVAMKRQLEEQVLLSFGRRETRTGEDIRRACGRPWRDFQFQGAIERLLKERLIEFIPPAPDHPLARCTMTNPDLRHHDWKFYPDDATFRLTGTGEFNVWLLEGRTRSMPMRGHRDEAS